MSILWADGFDHYGLDETKMLDGSYAQNVSTGNSVTLENSPVRSGTTSLNFSGDATFGNILRKALPNGAVTACGVSFALYIEEMPHETGSTFGVTFRDVNNVNQITLQILTTGALRVDRAVAMGSTLAISGGATVATTTGPAVVADAWQHIEYYGVFSHTVGVVKVRVNDIQVISVTNIDTINSLAECSQIAFTCTGKGASEAQPSYWIDDLYIYDTNGSHANAYPVGDLEALLLTATADTAEADWTPSTGVSGYAMIDEADPNDADYISGATATDRSDFAMTDLPVDVNYVETLFGHTRALKSDAGTAQIQFSLMQGTDQAAGSDRAITTAATYWPDNLPTDPTTGTLWTRTGVNSAKIRYDRTV